VNWFNHHHKEFFHYSKEIRMSSKSSSDATPLWNAGIIYNVTIKVEQAIIDEWLDWLLNEHIKEVMATECFTDCRVVRLLEVDETEGPTYAVQYLAPSKSIYNHYIIKYSEALRQKSYDRWGQRFIAFRSVMEVVQ
jgi:hypothetical protein